MKTEASDQIWDEILGLEEIGRSWASHCRALRKRRVLSFISILLVLSGLGVVTVPVVLQSQSADKQSAISERSAQEVAGWPYPQAEENLKAARAYNQMKLMRKLSRGA
jgi:sortase A